MVSLILRDVGSSANELFEIVVFWGSVVRNQLTLLYCGIPDLLYLGHSLLYDFDQ